ncbi:MAG: XdhC/CoxI family protein [Bacillota bacterium]|nr:XdhC/CoxI family protein [Bacillota bacterium]
MSGPFDRWLEALREGRAAVLVTALEEGSRLFVPAEGDPEGSLGDATLDRWALEEARRRLEAARPRSGTTEAELPGGRRLPLFFDVQAPPPELVLFGAGHDAVPLAGWGSRLGFRVRVVDPREAYATRERFPGAELVPAAPEELRERVPLGPRSYAVVMNHHLERDRACLRFALESQAAYVGLLGPRARAERILEDLRREGFEPSPGALARLHAPVGLDVGAEGPEEVAVSILAEVLAVRNGHRGGFLSERSGAIHAVAGDA